MHEYGGGALRWRATPSYFTNFDDQQIYRLGSDRRPRALSHDASARYADSSSTAGAAA